MYMKYQKPTLILSYEEQRVEYSSWALQWPILVQWVVPIGHPLLKTPGQSTLVPGIRNAQSKRLSQWEDFCYD